MRKLCANHTKPGPVGLRKLVTAAPKLLYCFVCFVCLHLFVSGLLLLFGYRPHCQLTLGRCIEIASSHQRNWKVPRRYGGRTTRGQQSTWSTPYLARIELDQFVNNLIIWQKGQIQLQRSLLRLASNAIKYAIKKDRTISNMQYIYV